MEVKVFSITKPLVEGLASGTDLIAYTARVSNPGNQMNTATAPKLVKYLIDHKHFSPLEMVDATVEIKGITRDIARQLLRHRSFVFQEFSQRYAEAADFVEPKKARRQDVKNRQNSIDDLPEKTQIWWGGIQDHVADLVEDYYQTAIKAGIAKECARTILPEGLTKSTLYMKGSFRSWLHYLEIRTDEATQLEHREVALAIQKALAEHEEIFKFGNI